MTMMHSAGYDIRQATIEDAAEVQALVAASDIAEFGEPDGYSLAELLDDWKRLDLERDAWVAVAPNGVLAGYGYIWPRQYERMDVEVYVHPAHTGRGIGTALVQLSEERARAHVSAAAPGTRVPLNNWINALNADARALLEREGYQPVRYFWRMEASLVGSLATPAWPTGIAVHTMAEEGDLRPVHQTVEEAMADHWGHVATPFEEWIERHTGATYDPSLWFVAMDGQEPAGAALCSISEGMGWINTLAVRRPWRRRGLGLALLLHAFHEFANRGLERIRLGVDAESSTGATRLYERAGMRVVQKHATYSKVIGDA